MKKTISFLVIIGFLIAALTGLGFLMGCQSTVKYEEYTGIIKCDIAIMTTKIKSKDGYSAFEVAGFIRACFSEIDRSHCKAEHFGDSPVSYDNRDERYVAYLACLGEIKN